MKKRVQPHRNFHTWCTLFETWLSTLIGLGATRERKGHSLRRVLQVLHFLTWCTVLRRLPVTRCSPGAGANGKCFLHPSQIKNEKKNKGWAVRERGWWMIFTSTGGLRSKEKSLFRAFPELRCGNRKLLWILLGWIENFSVFFLSWTGESLWTMFDLSNPPPYIFVQSGRNIKVTFPLLSPEEKKLGEDKVQKRKKSDVVCKISRYAIEAGFKVCFFRLLWNQSEMRGFREKGSLSPSSPTFLSLSLFCSRSLVLSRLLLFLDNAYCCCFFVDLFDFPIFFDVFYLFVRESLLLFGAHFTLPSMRMSAIGRLKEKRYLVWEHFWIGKASCVRRKWVVWLVNVGRCCCVLVFALKMCWFVPSLIFFCG